MKKNNYISELDGMRAIALLWVLLHHCLYGWAGQLQALTEWPKAITFVLSRGWLGVDLFFVLSGFLITGILLASKESETYWRNFYARRGLRILPLYYLVVVVLAFCYPGHGQFVVFSLLMVANFMSVFAVPVPHGGNVLWSLAVEQHFYLIWPLFVRWFSRRNLVWMGIAIFLLSPIGRAVALASGLSVDSHVYLLSWYRFDGLVLGALLAIWLAAEEVTADESLYLAGGLLSAAILVSIVGIPFGILKTRSIVSGAFRGTQLQLFFGSLLLAVVAMQGSKWTAILRNRFFKMTSNYSYCMYLVHLAIGDLFMHLWVDNSAAGWVSDPNKVLLLRTGFMLAASYGVGALSFHFFETPILGWKRYFSAKPGLVVSVPSSIGSGASGGGANGASKKAASDRDGTPVLR